MSISVIATFKGKDDTYEKALEWYNSEEYKPIKQIRLENSKSNQIILKGT